MIKNIKKIESFLGLNNNDLIYIYKQSNIRKLIKIFF